MGRTATAENPLRLQFLAAWIGMWLGEHQARVIEYQRAETAALLERDNVLLKGSLAPANENGRVQRRERLGGPLNFYHRSAT
jgi:hypothetical protein